MDEEGMKERLGILRDEIDGIDKTIVELLAQRVECAAPIAEVKRALGREIYDEERENQVFTKLGMYAQSLGLGSDIVQKVYEPILKYMRTKQHE